MRTNLYYLAATMFLLTGGIMFLSNSSSILQFVYIFIGLSFMSIATVEKKKRKEEDR
ncbi:hypothetical protein MKY91_08675 [Alkalicoccobacillus gibsonii]|uniref:DUF3953 domain-containing protein n=1 Tax=Alkalicoccobacillus gibsonii TaxID=79881 RepID=A0ABU9VH36_9BACI